MTLLDIDRLTLDLPNGARLLDGISLSVDAGETVGLVGESGSGKSLTARSVLGLPSAKTMSDADDPTLQGLRRRLEDEWNPGLCARMDLSRRELPVPLDLQTIRRDRRHQIECLPDRIERDAAIRRRRRQRAR